MKSVGQDTRYTYAVGRIRVLESRLVRQEIFERMLEEKDPFLSLKLLSESPDYSKEVSDLKGIKDFETILLRQLKNTYRIINELTKDHQITNLFFFRYDIHNIKVYLKTKFIRSIKPEPYIQLGLLSIEALIQKIKEERFKELPLGVGDIVLSLIRSSQSDIDIVLDKFFYNKCWEAFSKFKNPFLIRLYRATVDLSNIKIAIRLKILNESNLKTQEIFLEHGHLDKEVFVATKEASLEDFVSIFKRTEYKEIVRDAIKSFEEEATLVRLERLSGDFIMDFLKQAKYLHFGIEPLIGYLLAKENEIRTIKALVSGKLAGLPEDLIKNRICQSYI